MSKQNNLTDFLTDVADAIREKKGTTDKINPQNFSEEIRGIESGGGITSWEWNDVNFYDYEGTILYSYTWDEFVAKNEMPPLPTHHEGLVCQEWNYTLEEVLEQGGRCDVGAIYIPSDGKTHIKIQHGGNVEYHISFSASEIGGVTIDWGDGSTTTNSSTSVEYYSHLYNNGGKYDISISVNKGNINSFAVKSNLGELIQDVIGVYIGRGINSLGNDAFNRTSLSVITTPNSMVKFGERVFNDTFCRHINIPRGTASPQVFQGANLLETFSLPNTPITANQFYFNYMNSLKHMHIPSNLSFSSASFTIQDKGRLVTVSSSVLNKNVSTKGNVLVVKGVLICGSNSSIIPQDITSIVDRAFIYRGQLIEAIIPDSCTKIGVAAFNFCCGLKRLRLPEGLTEIARDAFGRLYSLKGVLDIPPSVSKIGNYAFSGTSYLDGFNFSRHTSIPTLSATSAFPSNIKLIVPDALYDQWIAATNWASLKARIVKASEFVEPTNE